MIFRTSRRQAVAGALLIAVGSAGAALAQQAFFRIGTGGTGGTYYPIGGLIANAISGQDGGKGVAGPRLDRGRLERLGREHQRDPGRFVRVGLHAVGRRLLGLHRHRPLRGQAQGPGPARSSRRSTPRPSISSRARTPTSNRSPTSRASASRSTSRARARSSTRGSCSPPSGSPRRTSSPNTSSPDRPATA